MGPSLAGRDDLSMQSPKVQEPPCKRHKADQTVTTSFASLDEDATGNMPSNYDMEFNFGELAHEFVATPVPGNDLALQSFGELFLTRASEKRQSNEGSEISSDEEKQDIGKGLSAPYPLVQGEDSFERHEKADDPDVASVDQTDGHTKRQAERAARNRESSRRAREKAKNRFRALENDNLALRTMVRRFRAQNEQILSQLDRTLLMQQACTMCRYSAVVDQRQTSASCQDTLLRP